MINSFQSFVWPIQGSVVGLSHWEEVEFASNSGSISNGILDRETGLIYLNDPRDLVRYKAVIIAAGMPAYLAAVIAYHILRIIPVLCYLTGRLIYQACTNKESKHFLEFFKEYGITVWTETKRSLINLARAPFYALAMLFGALYTLIDVYNGRKIVAAYEYAWNHQIALEHSIHIIVPQEEWSFKEDVHLIGKETGYYIPGCFQPFAEKKGEAICRPRTDDSTTLAKITQPPRRAAKCLFFC